MKTFLPFALFLLLCSNGIMAQTVDIKTRINALHKPLDFKNNHGFSGKDQRFEFQHPKNLKAILGIKPQTKLWTEPSGTSPGEPSLRARRSKLNQNFCPHAVAEALAQAPDAEREGGLKSALAGNQRLDSTIFETWDSTANHLVLSSKKIYSYPANENFTLIDYYTRDQTTSQWVDVKKSKRVITYDENGNYTSYIIYNLDGTTGHWVGLYKWEYAYDANGGTKLYLSSMVGM